VVKILSILFSLAIAAPAALADELPPMPTGSKCQLATNPPQEVEFDQTIFPCTRDDINRCNACERKVQRLEKIILSTPPIKFDWTEKLKVGAIGAGIGIVLGVVGGVWLGSKL
jgi:hypothetical protein